MRGYGGQLSPSIIAVSVLCLWRLIALCPDIFRSTGTCKGILFGYFKMRRWMLPPYWTRRTAGQCCEKCEELAR